MSYFSNKKIDDVVFTVRHKEYLDMNPEEFIKTFENIKLIIDGFNVISEENAKIFKQNDINIIGIGKSHWGKIDK